MPAIVDSGFDSAVPFWRTGSPAPLPAPYVFDGSPRAIRARVVAFAAKRYADMLYVTGLDRATADRHFRPRGVTVPGDLTGGPDAAPAQAAVQAAWDAGHIALRADDADRRATVTWTDPGFGEPVTASAIARNGYGGILLGAGALGFDAGPFHRPPASHADWPHGSAAEAPSPPADLARAADALFASSPGIYGLLIATPDSITFERYGAHGASGRPTPSWSMTKSMTATMVGRLIHEGWLASVYDAAPAPLWRDPRGVHALISIDDLLRMRSGLAFPVTDGAANSTLGFENSMVYQDAGNAFEVAQRCLVATRPGAAFRYVNSGPNVVGAIIRDRIEQRGLPYHATVYRLLADRIGMASYQHSADIAGNLIASGSGFATLRDYAKLGVLYLQDGCWAGERLLPKGWVEYALTGTHAGTNYAASFRTNVNFTFPGLPADAAWAVGASDQRIFILRGSNTVAAIANETDYPMDLAALNRVLAVAISG